MDFLFSAIDVAKKGKIIKSFFDEGLFSAMDKKQSAADIRFKNPPNSYWIASTPETNYPALKEDLKVDVAIVGGGMVGITSAYLLVQEGLKVAVLEADRILLGTSAHTTAKLTSQHGLIYAQLQKGLGQEKTKLYAEANESALHFVAKLIEEQQIDCDFSWQPAYLYTESEDYVQKIEDEAKAASDLGLKASFETKLELPLKIRGAVRFEQQAQFHSRKYLLALAQKIVDKGGSLFEQTRVVDLEGEGQGPYTLTTAAGHKVTAPHVIMAAHYPFNFFPGLYFTKLYTERDYAVVAKAQEKFPGGIYVNAENPTRSLRSLPTEEGERILIVGEQHKTGQGENLRNHYENLMDFAEQLFTVENFPYRWSAQDCTSLDDVPYIGRMSSQSPNLYVATGFRKWGMTHSTVSGLLLRDLIVKGKSPWEEVYDPSRMTTLSSAGQFFIQNADVAANLVSGKLESVPGKVEADPGEGNVERRDGQRVGVFKDEQGKIHTVDTSCAHLGCELHWNDAERSWDCPCHGSRYTVDGEILEGPTVKTLKVL